MKTSETAFLTSFNKAISVFTENLLSEYNIYLILMYVCSFMAYRGYRLLSYFMAVVFRYTSLLQQNNEEFVRARLYDLVRKGFDASSLL